MKDRPSFLRSAHLKAVFIDLDDTISDETAHMRGAYRKSFSLLKKPLSQQAVERVLREFQVITTDLYERNAWDEIPREQRWAGALENAGVSDVGIVDDLIAGYFRNYYEGVRFLPGAERLLDTASQFRTCLITNGTTEYQWGKLRKLGLDGRIDHILVSEDIGVRKPDRRIFDQALELTGAEPAEAVMIGDSLQADIAGAGALGIGTIWINGRGFSTQDAVHAPDAVVTNPGEAAELIESA